jgi:hypothetical protein
MFSQFRLLSAVLILRSSADINVISLDDVIVHDVNLLRDNIDTIKIKQKL